MKHCKGFPPLHDEEYWIGAYVDQTHLIKGRTVTVRGVAVRLCGCQEYPALQTMLRILQSHPRKRVITWHPKLKTWK